MEYRNKKARYLFLAGIVFLCMFLNLKANAAASMVGVPVVTDAAAAVVVIALGPVPDVVAIVKALVVQLVKIIAVLGVG